MFKFVKNNFILFINRRSVSGMGTSLDPQVIATTVMGAVSNVITTMCHQEFTQEPKFREKEIIEYNSRMRVFGLEKFNGPSYISSVNLYRNNGSHDIQNVDDVLGTMVLYLEPEAAQKIIKSLGMEINVNDENMILDNCGEFCNLVAGQYKNKIMEMGYEDLILSAPTNFINDVPGGVRFCYDEYRYYETEFFLWKALALVVAVCMGPVSIKS